MDSITISSFNCKNVKTSMHDIKKLCSSSQILFLQETWLTSSEAHILSDIDDNFYARSVTAIDSTSCVLRGRPHGGIAVMWHKQLSGCKVIETGDSRLLCFEILSDNCSILFINVYLPCDSYDNCDNFLYYLGKISSIINEHPAIDHLSA